MTASKSRLFALLVALALPTSHPAAAQPLPPPVVNNQVWKPTPGLRWQVQYEGVIDVNVQADAFMLDLFDTDAKTIATLKRRGKRLVCYLNAGAWENWRPDIKRFPSVVLGKDMDGWPGERWLDIRRIDLLEPIMTARLDLCRKKGFDGVIFDNVNSHINPTGFALTPADQLRYNVRLANAARAHGLAAGMNNNSVQAVELEPYFDWAQAESCFPQGWCVEFAPFTNRRKPVVTIEYLPHKLPVTSMCKEAEALSVDVIFKRRQLDAYLATCTG